MEIDHILPRTLGRISPLKNSLESDTNKQLIHKDCHKTLKTIYDGPIILAYRKIIFESLKRLGIKTLKRADKNTLWKITARSLLELIEKFPEIRKRNPKVLAKIKAIALVIENTGTFTSKSNGQKRTPSHRLENIKKIQDRKSRLGFRKRKRN